MEGGEGGQPWLRCLGREVGLEWDVKAGCAVCNWANAMARSKAHLKASEASHPRNVFCRWRCFGCRCHGHCCLASPSSYAPVLVVAAAAARCRPVCRCDVTLSACTGILSNLPATVATPSHAAPFPAVLKAVAPKQPCCYLMRFTCLEV